MGAVGQGGQLKEKDQTMPTGKVKWFNNAKGFGFILPDTGEEDLFAHYSSIEMDGYKTLKAGQAVTFDLMRGDKGMHATHIRVTEVDARKPQSDSLQNGSLNRSRPVSAFAEEM